MVWITYGFSALCVVLGVLCLITAFGSKWMIWWHGEGEAHQYQFFRCHGCRHVVTWHQLRSGGCPCHESFKMSPAKLRLDEKARLLYLPWMMTPRKARGESVRRARNAAERATLEGMVK